MKKFRSTFLLLGLFVLLLLVVVFFVNDAAKERRERAAESKPLLQERVVTVMTKVVFNKTGRDPVVLERSEGGVWKMGGFAVDADEQKKLLQEFAQFPEGKIVSRNRANWARYGLGDAVASSVTLLNGDQELTKIFVGNTGPTYKQVYIRYGQDDQVRLVESELGLMMSYDANRWRDMHLASVDPTQIKGVTARVGAERWTFQREGSTWLQPGKELPETDQQKMEQYLKDLLSLKGVSFEPDAKKFLRADNALALTMEDGTEYIVSISKNSDTESYAQITGQAELLKLSSDLSARLRPAFLTVVPTASTENAPAQQ